MAVKDTLLSPELNELLHDNLESVWCKVEISGSKPLHNCRVFRPPDSRSEPMIGLEISLDKLLTDSNLCHVHWSGDFNLNRYFVPISGTGFDVHVILKCILFCSV